MKTNGPRSGAFLSSWEWGEFQKATGKEIRREALEEKEEWKAAALCLKSSLPFGWRSWYCPRGPISAAGYTPEIFLSLADHLFHPLFLRAEPPREEHADFASISFGRGEDIRRSLEIQPSHTLLLSLDQSEDELLSGMHPKTRYNIHIAERKFVKIKTYSAKKGPLHSDACLLKLREDMSASSRNPLSSAPRLPRLQTLLSKAKPRNLHTKKQASAHNTLSCANETRHESPLS